MTFIEYCSIHSGTQYDEMLFPGHSVAQACADDIGTVVAAMPMLKALAQPFGVMECASGLTLKPPKCNLVPLVPFSDEVVKRVKRFLIEAIPQWKNFNIVPYAKYLGFYLGPEATEYMNHAAPFAKYNERARAIGAAAHSSVPATIAYNRDAVSVTSYVTQLVAPPKHLCENQYKLLASVFKIPFRALGNHAIFRISDQWGLPAPFDLFALSDAIAIRTASKTVSDWRAGRAILEAAFDRFASIGQLPNSFDTNRSYDHKPDAWLSPPHWKMQPMATRLNIADALEAEVLKGHRLVVKEIQKIVNSSNKSQKKSTMSLRIWPTLKPLTT